MQGKAVRLDQLAPGTKFRLFRTYRDGKRRPQFRYAKAYLADHTFEVRFLDNEPGVVFGVSDTGLEVTFDPGLRVKL